jgi:hypothetical protein
MNYSEFGNLFDSVLEFLFDSLQQSNYSVDFVHQSVCGFWNTLGHNSEVVHLYVHIGTMF